MVAYLTGVDIDLGSGLLASHQVVVKKPIFDPDSRTKS